MDILLNPNIAYLLLVAAILTTLLAIVTPGTGLLEVVALFCILLAGYSIYHLSFNVWAAIVLLLSILPFLIAVRKPGREIWLVVSILGAIIGSIFFFPNPTGIISVNPVLAVVTSLLTAAFLWISIRKVMQIAATQPSNDLSALVGQVGEAKTSVERDGSVQVAGELWSARSDRPIPVGSAVRVLGRDGFVLLVEKDNR